MKTSSRFAAFVARVINFAPRGRASYTAERKVQITGSSFQLLLREKALFNAAFMKLAQTFLFLFAKVESKIFAVITGTKFVIEFVFGGDQPVEIGEVLIAQSAQPVGDGLEVANFRSDQPERVYKWKTDKLVPLFAEVPELKFPRMSLPETDSLIADEKARCRERLEHRRVACAASGFGI